MPATPELAPHGGRLYVVRWIRSDGRNAKHRYYRRHHDAEAFHAKLILGGWTAALYVTPTNWQESTNATT